jgi:hypothetical protein
MVVGIRTVVIMLLAVIQKGTAEPMNFDGFTGEIQHRLEFPGAGETVRAIRATLMTLGRRIPEGNAEDCRIATYPRSC